VGAVADIGIKLAAETFLPSFFASLICAVSHSYSPFINKSGRMESE